jgi:hypothetical protein
MISSGGTGRWKPLEQVWLAQPLRGVWKPLKDVQFGRFDPNDLSRTRRTTHAFYRKPDGQWYVKKLSEPARDWKPVQSSSFPMSALRFGDFTGDGVTDVLAVENGHWAYSASAHEPWQPLNNELSDPLAGLFIANMDAEDNIDDILRLEIKPTSAGVDLTWLRSKDGRFSWKVFKRYSFPGPIPVRGPHGFVGRFSAASGGTLNVDADRIGHFFAKRSAEVTDREWRSLFAY